MSKVLNDRSHSSNAIIWIVLVFLVSGAVVVGFPLLARTLNSSGARERDTLRELSNQPVVHGRLFLAVSDSPGTDFENKVQRAQINVLPIANSSLGQRIQSLIFLATHKPHRAAEILEALSQKDPRDVEVLNDLAVAYMTLGDEDPLNYFKAITSLQQAKQISPNASVLDFNIGVGYRAVGLTPPETEDDQRSEATSAVTEEAAVAELRSALEKSKAAGEQLFAQNPDVYRRAATAYALNLSDPGGQDPLIEFINEQLQTKYQDRTIAAMLAPLRTSARAKVVRSRQLVRDGVDAYFDARLQESLNSYDQAAAELADVDSSFDQLWVKLNRADTENRGARLMETRKLLDEVITVSRQQNLRWMLGLALAAKGSALPLSDNFANHLKTLTESLQIFSDIAATRDAARPLYYAAMTYYIAGNLEDSARYAFRALKVTSPDDHVRRTQLLWLAGTLIYRLGYPSFAIPFEEESVAEAHKTDNLPRVATAMSNLASIYEATHQYDKAERYMSTIRDLENKIDVPVEKQRASFSSNLVCGRIYLRKGKPEEAGKCLQENINVFAREPNPLRFSLSESLLLLAKVHTMSNQVEMARAEFRKAIDVVESDDNYLVTEKLRLPFENERRDLYDTAISFEYDHGDVDTAWTYTQRYRSKLFLEFLGQTNPTVKLVHGEAIDRDRVQKLIPPTMQIIEFVMLPDRLLIWLVSDKVFISRSVPISRTALEKKISDFVAAVRNQDSVREKSEELYSLLIAPVGNLLDRDRAIAIIPDQALHRLPFAALHSTYSNDFLIAEYTLLESPNLTHLLAAASTMPARSSVVSFGARTDDVSIGRELSGLASIYQGSQSYSGAKVEKASFLSAMRTASIFHYAGHSEDAADPLRSSVLLDGDREGPNSITAVDISQQTMRPNSVVVLASCDSSVGNSQDGIGMRGLTSAFLISGAGSVVGSLWPVETTSTSDLVIRFHEGFAMTKTPVAQALRQAQLSFIKTFPDRSHPYYWSGFVVTGNSSALR